jgi:hypothetical protein
MGSTCLQVVKDVNLGSCDKMVRELPRIENGRSTNDVIFRAESRINVQLLEAQNGRF